jgi:hypothetical protein
MRACLLRWSLCCSSCRTGLPLAIRLPRHSKTKKRRLSFFPPRRYIGDNQYIAGIFTILVSPITSFHDIGDNRYYRDILESVPTLTVDDDVFYLFLQKQKIGAELHIYLEEGTYHKRLFRGPNTNDMKK